MKVMVVGATGYVGARLVPLLIKEGHNVSCVVRNPEKLLHKNWHNVEIIKGDVLDIESLFPALAGIEILIYLVHSLNSENANFDVLDRQGAVNIAQAAQNAQVKRIIYLGGLGEKTVETSEHLLSRHEVGNLLRESNIPVTEFRAAAIIGSGSASFEIIHHLVNRLPLMICPKWVFTKTQPVAISDVLKYLISSVNDDRTTGKTFDIGCSKVWTHGEMILEMARHLRLKRWIIRIPVLTPRLSSYWVSLFSPLPFAMCRSLVESLKYETTIETDLAQRYFGFEPMQLEAAIGEAIWRLESNSVETRWSDAGETFAQPDEAISQVQKLNFQIDITLSQEHLFREISRLGGNNGYYFMDWAWNLRGFLDTLVGGVGRRRGRKNPEKLAVGDSLDFWRVEVHDPPHEILLRAEMKMPGTAWLSLKVKERENGGSSLQLTAMYYPKGVLGYLYWFLLYPVHMILFPGMTKAIAQSALENFFHKNESSSRKNLLVKRVV
jgi:uncharacterized protein YbjT (DUF2867 family)